MANHPFFQKCDTTYKFELHLCILNISPKRIDCIDLLLLNDKPPDPSPPLSHLAPGSPIGHTPSDDRHTSDDSGRKLACLRCPRSPPRWSAGHSRGSAGAAGFRRTPRGRQGHRAHSRGQSAWSVRVEGDSRHQMGQTGTL